MFRNRRLKTCSATVVLASFVWMTSGGSVWAEYRAAKRAPARFLDRLADDPRLALSGAEKDYLRRMAHRATTQAEAEPVRMPVSAVSRHAERNAAVTMQEVAAELDRLAASSEQTPEKLAGLKQRLEVAHARVVREAARVRDRVRSNGLPNKVLDRHDSTHAGYLEEFQAVLRDLDTAIRSQSKTSMISAAERLRRSTDERPGGEPQLDPARLPFRVAEPVQRQPGLSLGFAKEQARAGEVAALATPAAADLAENEDVRITSEIRALAASLGNEPVRIYDWVRNHVEIVPTYGSVQGSQMTLDAKRGNPFDIASLLIALLRAAGVPARYALGTVEVPVAKVMSWVGGVPSARLAQQLLGQGGIPNVALTSGGTITHIRLDHVWVEAFVDNIPSRGAMHRQGDTWLPLDASFKLHQVKPKSKLFTDLPISTVLNPSDHLFDVDEFLGRVTNLDDEILDERLSVWVEEVDDYMRANGVVGSIDGLLGGRDIVQEASTVFAGSLPYEVIRREGAVSTLAASLRHSVTINGYTSQLERAQGTASLSVKLSLPALNSHRLGIQFDPATQSDADVLEAARSGGASSLPVYLVDVVPVVKLDGVPLGSGSAVPMGSRYLLDVVLAAPEGPSTVPYQVVAGDEIAVGITGNGLTKEVVEKRFAGNPVDNAPEYLHQVQLHYWAETDHFAEVAARGQGVYQVRLPSVGLFSSPLTVSYLFGAPRSGVYQSRTMDVRQSVLGVAGEKPSRIISFMKQAGIQGSYLEGAVFDQIETIHDPEPSIRGISAVHLLWAAMVQDTPVYRITAANSAAVLPRLELDAAVETDITRALIQGATVLAPERNVVLGVWSGAGYIVQDEITGAGAYMISGGLNGGGLLDCLEQMEPNFVQFLTLVLGLMMLMQLLMILLGAIGGLAPAVATAAVIFGLLLLFFKGMGPMAPAPLTA